VTPPKRWAIPNRFARYLAGMAKVCICWRGEDVTEVRGMKRRYSLSLLALVPSLVLVLGQSGSADPGSVPATSPADGYCGYDVQLEVAPALPAAHDAVSVIASGVWPDACKPTSQAHEVVGRTIRIDAAVTLPPDAVCALVVTPWEFNVEMGVLPDGPYRVDLYIADRRRLQPPVLCATRSFVVGLTRRSHLPSIQKETHP
jgi:hypothetical protein